jgi:phosphomethylpyrimidine synthase
MAVSREERARSDVATLIHYACKGIPTQEMEEVARDEGLPPQQVMEEVASGRMIIPANAGHRSLRPVGIGLSCTCKINANIGASSIVADTNLELDKMHAALLHGADTVMDLSSGGDIEGIRRFLLDRCSAPFGTVPIYEAVAEAGNLDELTDDRMIDVIRRHAEQGVDFVTVHCGILRDHIPLTKKRLTGIVSRGGSILAQWMIHNDRENPLYERFDEILDICRRHDLTLSLGDGLRPGCLADASDEAQFAELEAIASLGRRCREAQVQVMIEGPGHVPFDQIQMNVERQQTVCDGAPFYVLGPLVTDIAPGYDHITGAIGGVMAAYHGASLLCYVTPKEHLSLPDIEDVREGVVAFKIAAHAADVARGRRGARARDDAMSRARFAFNWEEMFRLSIDPDKARKFFKDSGENFCDLSTDYCSMCGPKFCAMKLTRMIHEDKILKCGTKGGGKGSKA